MAFDPDKYLAEKSAPQGAGAFNPDKYLAEKTGQPSSWMDRKAFGVSPRGLLTGTANALPAIGAVGGGIAGGLSPVPGGAFIGAGAGGVAGESLKKTIEQWLLDAPPETREKFYKDLAATGALSVAGEGAGQLIAGPVASSFAKSGVKDIAQNFARPGVDEVRAAAQSLNVKPTEGMLTDDYVVRNLENSLSQSPSVPGSAIRSEQRPIFEAINDVSKGALSDASSQSEVQAGKNIKAGIDKNLRSRYEPIQQSYNEIESHTSNVPLNKNGLSRVSNNIRKLDEAKFSGSDAHKVANQFADWLEQAENVNDIKILKTKARQIAQDPKSSYEQKSVASSIMGKLDQAQTNSITRQAVSIAKEAPVASTGSGKFLNKSQKAMANAEAEAEGQDIGRKLVGDIKKTNKEYRSLMDDARKFGKGSGLTKAKNGMSATLDDIANANPQDAASALFDSGNIEFTSWVKDKMPAEYEIARQQRLSEIAQKASDPNGTINPNKLQKLVGKMTPEETDLLFGGESVKRLKDAGVLLKSLPEKVGASDTPRGLSFHDLGLVQNATDAGRYGLLKGKKYAPAVGKTIKGAKPLYQGLIQGGLLD